MLLTKAKYVKSLYVKHNRVSQSSSNAFVAQCGAYAIVILISSIFQKWNYYKDEEWYVIIRNKMRYISKKMQ